MVFQITCIAGLLYALASLDHYSPAIKLVRAGSVITQNN